MLGVLFESRARRQRRSGGAALSVAVHVAIIGTVAAATSRAHHASADRVEPVKLVFTPPPPPAPTPPRDVELVTTMLRFATDISAPTIAIPTSIPTSLPPIEPAAGLPAENLTIGWTTQGAGARSGDLTQGSDATGSADWRGTEVFARIVSLAKPRYPETLRSAGIDGRVLVRFSVDTLGKIDLASVRVIESTHSLFSQAVRDVLPAFRFKPAEVNGRRVVALAEMPFEFAIRK